MVTNSQNTGLDRVQVKTEHAFAQSPSVSRRTEYEYRFGRLSAVRADRLAGGSPDAQRTWLKFGANPANDWGAEVVDVGQAATGTRVISNHGGHVRSMHLPDVTDSQFAVPSLVFRYDFLGRVAERLDERDVVLRYGYDALDRLASVLVGHYTGPTRGTGTFVAGYPPSMPFAPPGGGRRRRSGWCTWSTCTPIPT